MALSNPNSINNDMKDALEAYQTFRSARSLFFWIILISLVVLQTIFWVVNQGKIDTVLNFDQEQSSSVFVHHVNEPFNLLALQTAEEPSTPDSDSHPEPDAKRQQEITKHLDTLIRVALRFFNTVICFAALLYCLSLLIGMKVSLVGRLGGLTESGKAFFLSLVVLVLIVPWQPLIAGTTPGTLFSYQELTQRYVESTTYLSFLDLDAMAYYVRFVGFCGLALILLLAAQWRSNRAARQILQRCRAMTTPPAATFIAKTEPLRQNDSGSIPIE